MRAAAEQRLAQLVGELAAQGIEYEPAQLAEGFVRVANAHMAKAIRSISVAKGIDVREYVLVPFGGAAGQHASRLPTSWASLRSSVIPMPACSAPMASAWPTPANTACWASIAPYSEQAVVALENEFQQLVAAATADLLAEGAEPDRLEVHRALELRYQGIEQSLTVADPRDAVQDGAASRDPNGPAAATYAAAFVRQHRQLYGYEHAGRPLEIVTLRVEVRARSPVALPRSERLAARAPGSGERARVFLAGFWQEARLWDRNQLHAGDVLAGPAIVVEASSTTVIEPGWTATVLSQGELLLERRNSTACDSRQSEAAGSLRPVAETADPIWLEIFNHQFAGIAEQMGITLRNTATSVNVKERLDFSCAIFTPEGDLVVNAPHIPVHLGAMSETVKRILADNPDLAAGDVFVTNHPYRGGSHLPDITVVTPVFDEPSGRLAFFTASRAHHAEIGGIVPGSMPPFSHNLAEEGVLIGNFRLFERGEPASANWKRCSARPNIPVAIRPRIWPTSRPRWPPIAVGSAI